MNWGELLLGGLVGAVVGMLLEQTTHVVRSSLASWKYRDFRGSYSHDGGTVAVTGRLGHRFDSAGSETDPANNWTGHFDVIDTHDGIGAGTYHHASRSEDWGLHHLRLLDNGDISVQWENMGGGERRTGSVVWNRVEK